MEEELTYEILEQRFKEQERLIAEGKMQKSKIIYGLSSEGRAIVEQGITLDDIFRDIFGDNWKGKNDQ